MSYQALARKWRPKNFEQVLGQEHVVSALVNALDNERVHHAFLFTGTRGVGKTTLARIFARALNCERGVSSTPCGECAACSGVDNGNFIDLIEVDAASRTKVDDTRELLDNVQYTPTQGRFKIYLIDEVHMLSTHSFNALLKTLEEPPAHVKFLLATTDPQKLPATILSRCIQFNLKSMESARLGAFLEKILSNESVECDRAALLVLARAANGSVRDSLSLLDQGIAYGNGEVREEAMRAMLGMIERGFTHKLLAQVCKGDAEAALTTVTEMAARSVDFAAALDEMLSALHNAALGQVNAQALEWKGVDAAELQELCAVDAELLQLLYQIALLGKRDLGLAPEPRSGFEMILLRMIAFRPEQGGAPAKVSTPAVTAAAVTAASPASPSPPPASPTPAAPAETLNIPLETLTDAAQWASLIAQSGLHARERDMLMHMSPQSVDGGALQLILDDDYAHLNDPARIKNIEQHLSARLPQPLKLQVSVGKVDAGNGGGTPAARARDDRRAQQKAAEQSFRHDPKVREFVDAFDGVVVEESIQPASASAKKDAETHPTS